MKKSTFILIFFMLLGVSCQIIHENVSDNNHITVVGEGAIMSKDTVIADFKDIEVNGSGKIELKTGLKSSVLIEDFANLLEFYEVSLINEKLIIGRKKNFFFRNSKVNITITTTKNVESIEQNGSSRMLLKSGFENISKILLTGSGNIEAVNFSSTNFCDVVVSGSGDVNLINFPAKKLKCNISGSGNVQVNVLEELDATINGSGNISFIGNPVVKSKISGSGKVKKL